MGAQWVGPTLTDQEAEQQRYHDKKHPGLVCQSCPTEMVHRRDFELRKAAWMKREEWRIRWLPVIVLAVLLGCWVFGIWLLGPS